jgi:hypothetical protein
MRDGNLVPSSLERLVASQNLVKHLGMSLQAGDLPEPDLTGDQWRYQAKQLRRYIAE